MTPPHRGQCSRAGLAFTNQTLVGGLDETSAVPSGRPARPEAASSVAPVASGYEHSLRPCLGTISAPRGRARFRQALQGAPADRQLGPAEAGSPGVCSRLSTSWTPWTLRALPTSSSIS